MNQSQSDSAIPPVKKRYKKLNLIQVYRGLAALLVLLHHGDIIFKRELNKDFLGDFFRFGFAGVDFFFVLSGFIIFYIHQSDIGHPSKFKSFILKRFIRIYPLYWIILTSKLAASAFLGYGGDVRQPTFWDILKAFTLYPQEDGELLFTRFLGVSWTLSYEIFFYLVIGLLLLVKPTKFLLPALTVWLVGSFINLTGALDNIFNKSFMLNFIFNERNLEFVLGGLAAYIVSRYEVKYEMILISVATFLLTLSAINSNYNLTQIPFVICYGLPFTLLLVGSVAIENKRTLNIHQGLVLLGDSSYAIYLMHGFIISNIAKLIVKSNLTALVQNVIALNALAIIIAIITVAIGCAIYFYLEQPLLTALRSKLLNKVAKKAT